MDYQEAIEALSLKGLNLGGPARRMANFCGALDAAIYAMQEIQQYKQLGTLEEIKNDVEKQIPKSPTYDGDGYAPDGTFVWDEWLCPCCGSRFGVDYEEHDYCPNCGQHILWEVEDEQ